jgi:hypothetical protein
MNFIEIHVIAPNGDRYKAEVDEDADTDALLQDLIATLKLPTTEKGKPIDYTIKLVDALRIHNGATIEIARAKPTSSVRSVVKE